MHRLNQRIPAFVWRISAVVGGAACLWVIAGCGPKSAASTSGTVSGTVTVNGAPLKSGMVHVAPAADAPGWMAPIGEKGAYVAGYVAPGTHKVWLSDGSRILPAGIPRDKAFQSVPEKYLSADTTPLSVTVTVGRTADLPIAIGE